MHIDPSRHTSISFPKLNPQDMNKLRVDISYNEVKHALFQMAPWKAPGPDGRPGGFFQHSWDTIGDNIYITYLWSRPDKIYEVNKTEICLIPKLQNPTLVQ